MSIFAALLSLILPPQHPAGVDLMGAEKALFMIAEAATLSELDKVLGRLPGLGLSPAEWAECQAAVARRMAEIQGLEMAA